MVHLHGRHVADLLRSRDGKIELAYTDRYLDEDQRVPLSLSLPPSKPDDAQAARWIDGLLPANPRVRDRWADLYGAATPAPFDLLSTRLGHDCAGSVQFCRASETSQLLALESGTQRLTVAGFADLIDEVSADPVGWGSSGNPLGGFSLAGAYPKVALVQEPDGHWSRPYGNTPWPSSSKRSEPQCRICPITPWSKKRQKDSWAWQTAGRQQGRAEIRRGPGPGLGGSRPAGTRRPGLRTARRRARPGPRALRRPQPAPRF